MNTKLKKASTHDVDCALIKMSKELDSVQNRMPMSFDDFERLKNDIQKHGVLESIVCYEVNFIYYLLAGYHRLKASRELGIKTIPVIIYDMTKAQRKNFCIENNLNRRHMTRSQKQSMIKLLIKKNPKASSREIGRRAGVDGKTVEKHRKTLKENITNKQSVIEFIQPTQSKETVKKAVKKEVKSDIQFQIENIEKIIYDNSINSNIKENDRKRINRILKKSKNRIEKIHKKIIKRGQNAQRRV